MTGYCKFCGERIQGPPALASDADKGRASLLGLGLVMVQHITQKHLQDAASVLDSALTVQSLVALFCLEAPAAVPATAPANDQAGQALSFRHELDRLRSEVCGWINQDEPVRVSRVVPAGGVHVAP